MSVDETTCILRMTRQPLSLDQPVGEHDDTYFGEFLEDYREDDPLMEMNHDMLKSRIADVLQSLELSRAGDPPPALRAGRRLRLHAGGGGQDLFRHAGAGPPDRDQGGAGLAASRACPATQRLPGRRPSPRRGRAAACQATRTALAEVVGEAAGALESV